MKKKSIEYILGSDVDIENMSCEIYGPVNKDRP